MYATRTPITDDNYAAFLAAQAELAASLAGNPNADTARAAKPLISNAAGQARVMSGAIMGEWLRARPGVTEADIAKEFTATERERFLDEAIDYAIRRSGDVD